MSKIENAKITNVNLSMQDHGCLTLHMTLEGNGWSCVYGGYCLGNGYLGADKFEGHAKSIEYLMRIMDTVGVESFQALKGKYIRVESESLNGPINKINKIGNLIEDKWFDQSKFFSEASQDGR